MQNDQHAILEHAADLLRLEPWHWAVTVEYPGFLLVSFDRGQDTARAYAAGFTNPTLTVDQQTETGDTIRTVDTHVQIICLDGYRFAIHTVAAIDRMEHEGWL